MVIRRFLLLVTTMAAVSLALIGLPRTALASTSASLPALEKVMAGASSSGNDQVWIRVSGQPANVPADCVYQAWSLFFVPDDTVLSRDRALALLMTAKSAGQPVEIAFDVMPSGADFWGFGISRCVMRRIAVGG